ncbi:MAG: D-alanine--D-alanine ligase [Alphaproteobacteria bacterium]
MKKQGESPGRIAVLMGGPGSEREVSLATGRGVAKALRSIGADVTEIDVRNEDFQLPEGVDLAFITIHGTFGEDGQIQRILERRGIAYTGDGVSGSETSFDKIRTKEKFREHGIPTPPWEIIHPGQQPTIPLPIVVKPPREGSTVGVIIVKDKSEIESAIGEAAKYGRELLIEKFVSGRELTIGILGDQALPIIEIIPKGGFYDFNNKYPFLNPQAGGGAEHVCPANIDAEKTKEIQALALRAFQAAGLQVYGRVDAILSENGQASILEINTIPGMTEASLLPEAAAVAGIGYADLCAKIIALSRLRQGRDGSTRARTESKR